MNARLLSRLRCPFCGGPFQWAAAGGGEEGFGKLLCDCCAYPVVSGIPFLRTGALAREILRMLDRGAAEAVLPVVLEMPEDARPAFVARRRQPEPLTFRETLELLPAGAEGPYLLHRFSDPTYLVSEAAVRAFASVAREAPGPALDLGGGAGHLTRTLTRLFAGQDVTLADLSFWKLWLAKSFVAPECQPVCCDANVPLPFAPGTFAFVFSSDAFHYIWSKRLLAEELMRAVGDHGTILLAHLHNALVGNESAGMPLAPAGWRRLFETRRPRLFRESTVLESVLSCQAPDFSAEFTDDDLAGEPSLLLSTGTPPASDVVEHEAPAPLGGWRFNPLYQTERVAGGVKLRLEFPNAAYAAEFAAGRRYLPEQVDVSSGAMAAMRQGALTEELRPLLGRRVVLDLPEHYLP